MKTVHTTSVALALLVLLGCDARRGEMYRGSLGGVDYEVRLPAGSALVRTEDLSEMQMARWEPASGEGLVVVVQVLVGVDEPCRGDGRSEGGGSEQVDGVWRPVSFSVSRCLGDGARHIRCAVWHTRGHLRADELDAARAVRASFRARP